MKKLLLYSSLLIFASCAIKKAQAPLAQNDVERIIKTLSSDEMQGRAVFTPGIEKAARFIEDEFKQIGLEPMATQGSFRQEFSMMSIMPSSIEAKVNGLTLSNDQILVISDQESSNIITGNAEVHEIKAGEAFMQQFRTIVSHKKPVVVFVDAQFADAFNRVRQYYSGKRIVNATSDTPPAVFILGVESSKSYDINFKNSITKMPLNNIAGIIPGKTKATEFVIFSGHYDHLGIIEADKGDSIANGADDDASGITAVISLARHYKKLNNNARTLIFVAFTGEESGMLGSKYFSEQMNPDDVTAMFNIEMIGKESKFGKKAAFITGFDQSDFGEILQKNLVGTGFTFHPDPYKEQNLFYRSDNATLAALGVPAHTISTDKIDVDKFYHTVKDELETLDVENIKATIEAIALSSRGIVNGTETPRRIPPLKPRK